MKRIAAQSLAIPGRAACSCSRCSRSALLAIWWRGPEWNAVYHAFDAVTWRWVIVGVLLNLLSVLARSLSWRLTIDQALPEPHPRFGQVFSAFGIGLLGNAVLPGPGRRVRARRRAAPAPPARPGHERDAARHRLRAPPVRPVPGRDPRHLGPADREDPALGRDEPDHLRARRLRPPDGRLPLRPHRRRPRPRRDGQPARAPDHGPPGARGPAPPGAGARRRDVPAASAG